MARLQKNLFGAAICVLALAAVIIRCIIKQEHNVIQEENIIPRIGRPQEHSNRVPVPREKCPSLSPHIVGRSPVNLTYPTPEELASSVKNVGEGGTYTPPDCNARQSIVIIIPYRDREEHLRTMLRHIHPFLQRQQAQYSIVVVEEIEIPLFNRALNMNIGFLLATDWFGSVDCFIFHDVDKLPEDDRNMYRCSENNPVHLSVQMSQYHYRLFYKTLIGGVLAMTPRQFAAVNGFSNNYWGWGKEDDDMYERLTKVGMSVERHDANISRYACITHPDDASNMRNGYNMKLLTAIRRDGVKDFMNEGLRTVSYGVINTTLHPLYTHVKVEAASPLSQYRRPTDAIPCLSDSASRLGGSLEMCASSCNDLGPGCIGFIYNFSQPVPQYNCYLKEKMCSEMENFARVSFLMKKK